MLKKINSGGVVSDEGFSIQITGPETLKYKNGSFEVEFDLGYDKQHRKIYIYISDSSTWDKYVGSQKIDKVMKAHIIRNISDSVKLLNGDFEIVQD